MKKKDRLFIGLIVGALIGVMLEQLSFFPQFNEIQAIMIGAAIGGIAMLFWRGFPK